ncbi:MAG TPA: phosphotransferase [Ktedonobacterales bacterium]|nr:phosphotransferase [Ktedonobacterales bacterium]
MESLLIAELVRQEYDAEPIELEPLGNDPTGERVTYRAALSDGRVLMLRGQRIGSRVPFWYGGGVAEEWLRERALVLDWLARQDYPAPRLVPARHGKVLATHADYCTLAMTYLPGQPLLTTIPHLERLAGALSRLHALEGGPGGGAGVPGSWWHPLDRTITPLLEQLEDLGGEVPLRWQPLHAAFVETLGAFLGRDDLPLVAIHGDCYPANAIETGEGQVVLIDWDCAGWGTAVLDLGGLLLDAQPDPAPGEPIVVDPQLVAAMVASYRKFREPTALEREALLEATRFGTAFIGALHFTWTREQGWSERIERSLRRLQARYTAAEEVARLAREACGGST